MTLLPKGVPARNLPVVVNPQGSPGGLRARPAGRVRSVANLTRQDAVELLARAPKVPVRSHVVPMPLAEANAALVQLRSGALTGAALLVP